jgi:hypothetical protein
MELRRIPFPLYRFAVMKFAISRETDAERMALAVSRLSVAKKHFASELPG